MAKRHFMRRKMKAKKDTRPVKTMQPVQEKGSNVGAVLLYEPFLSNMKAVIHGCIALYTGRMLGPCPCNYLTAS